MNKNFIEAKERFGEGGLGVFEEVSRLDATLAWGPTGVEAVLATLIPEDKSLFFGKMDVLKARKQYDSFENVLLKRGSGVIRVRDLAALALMNVGGEMPAKNLIDLRQKILNKAERLISEYGRGMGEVTDCIYEILVDDANYYESEEASIRLNAELAKIATNELPLANLLFGRDQSNMVGDTLYWSNMRKEIRDPEVSLWKMALRDFMGGMNSVEVKGDGRLEGGDLIVHKGDCLVGVGGRSNQKGVEQIAPSILNSGLRLFEVYHPGRDGGLLEHQTTMHLDTFYMPGPKNTAVVLIEEAEERQLFQLMSRAGQVKEFPTGNFADYIYYSGEDIIPLSREQQLGYQANFVVLDEKSVLLTTSGDGYLKKEFEKRGIEVVDGNLSAITQGYGGAHCSITPILRS